MRAVSITPRNPRFPAYPGCPTGRRGFLYAGTPNPAYTGLMKLGDQPMAQFKEATLLNGDKIIVNIEEIRVMQRFPTNTTTIHFAADHGVQISETPNDLMMSKQHWSR